MKKSILTLMLFISINIITAQSYKGDTHLGFRFVQRWHISIGIGALEYPYGKNFEHLIAVNYAPQFDLTLRYSDLSLSLNSQLAAGYHFKFSYDNLKYPFYDIPLFLQGNLGHMSSKDFYSFAGLFVGGGYDWTYIKNQFQQRLAMTFGLRTWVGRTSVTVRLNRSFANVNAPYAINAVSLDINIGSYLAKVADLNKISNFMKPYK
jgi:hypothetical protein